MIQHHEMVSTLVKNGDTIVAEMTGAEEGHAGLGGGKVNQEPTRSRPILFSTPMVRAIVEGRKTQTRRIVKPQPDGWAFNLRSVENLKTKRTEFVDDDYRYCVPCPYGRPGDRLWVREAWASAPDGTGVLYRADHHAGLEKQNGDQKWKPSIHMLQRASRITLEITGIRVQRVQSISEKDAIAEGIEKFKRPEFGWKLYGWLEKHEQASSDPVLSYETLWNSINGPESWSENPWVWVVEFKRV